MNCLYIHCTCAIVIAVAIISLDMNTRIVHLGAAPLLSLAVGNTGELGLSFKYEGEDAGTAGVRTTDCVAAGVRVSPLPVSSILRVGEGGVRSGISLCSLLLCPDCRDCRLPVTMLYDPEHQEKPEVTPDLHCGSSLVLSKENYQ